MVYTKLFQRCKGYDRYADECHLEGSRFSSTWSFDPEAELKGK